MSGNSVDTMARLHAERLMRGDSVGEAEMRVIIAGLMLSVDRLTQAVDAFGGLLWSEEKLRVLIRDEVAAHCRARYADGSGACRVSLAVWFGRLLRGLCGK